MAYPLFDNFVFLLSGKMLNVHYQRTSRFKNSFVPSSICLYNNEIGNHLDFHNCHSLYITCDNM